MAQAGTVKWFNKDKGYGFITQDSGGPELFFHITDLQAAGIAHVSDGQRLFFEVKDGQGGKKRATSISLS